MRKLALRDEILLQIDKAARYIGGEVNAVMKNKEDVDIRFAMAFPDVYEIGMSNLGMMILYDMFNKRDDVWCERLFSPWTDLDKIMREEHIPLFTLESQDPVKEFDFLGITLGYEMCYTKPKKHTQKKNVLYKRSPVTGSQWNPTSCKRTYRG